MGTLSDRPLIAKLLAVPAYLERYHGLVQKLVTGYLEPGQFETRVRQMAALIDPYVKEDPTKLFTYEQFVSGLYQDSTAVPAADTATAPGGGRQGGAGGGMMGGSQIALVPFMRDRVANVQQQLDGTLPAKGDGSGLGQSGVGPGGGRGGAMPAGAPGAAGQAAVGQRARPDRSSFQPGGAMPPMGQLPQRMVPGGFSPDGAAPATNLILGLQPSMLGVLGAPVILLAMATTMVWRLRHRP